MLGPSRQPPTLSPGGALNRARHGRLLRMHRCWPAVRAGHKGNPFASAAGRPGVHAGTLRAACAAGASPAPHTRAGGAGRHNRAAGGAVACSVRSDGGPACPSGAPGRACRLSMGSPRRRTSGMHSAAAPRSAAMRRLSSAARSLALASASAATDRNAPCKQDAKLNMFFAEPRPGEAACAPGTPALAAASRGARGRALRALATVKRVNPVQSHRPEGAWRGASLCGRALDTRASTHLNTYVSGAWNGSTKAWLLLLHLPSSRCCPPNCVSCAPGPQACTQARPCKRAGLPGCHA